MLPEYGEVAAISLAETANWNRVTTDGTLAGTAFNGVVCARAAVTFGGGG
jgi:hypothetical protein